MADVIDTPLRLFCEMTVDRRLAGRYQLEVQRRVEENGAEIVGAQIKVIDVSAQDAAAIINTDAARITADLQAAHAQIADLQERLTLASAARDIAQASLNAVRSALPPLPQA